ncbi:MauE/DoxX family redox-associated membrane protein [Flavobacterium procerum]|uniref:MauE/DoxX family redox-associated membrane protein n=1 Tax=Flavobacterium procerum TaxID=1455569 RepID=A0ABV6BQP2_9FLAO
MAVILSSRFKKIIVDVVCLLYILLFVYAAVSKILDFEKFQVQLGQSPLFSAFAGWISWSVLLSEFIIVFFLLIPKTKMRALYAGFCLMSMFSAYIFIMLYFSSFIPCSCGGILEKMSWTQHLIFNLLFVLLAGVALWIDYNDLNGIRRKSSRLPIKFYLFTGFFGGTIAVILLYLSSEEIMQHQNPFIRRYPHHIVTFKSTVDLKYNSYYFAGSRGDKLYMGNSTVPLYLLSVDAKLKKQKIRVKLDRDTFLFKSIKLAVQPPHFYIIDGRTPAVFIGETKDWQAFLQEPKPPYFNIAVPVDSLTIAFRGISKNANILGFYKAGNKHQVVIAPNLLEKQIDGIFDTDGMLHYSEELKRIVYIYSYRNQYIVADQSGKLVYRANTIDTISHAKIKVAYLKDKTEQTVAAPILSVNASSCVYGHLLFVNSNVPGHFEKKSIWNQASVIDVYDLNAKAYLFSFHIYNIDGKKIRSFLVTENLLYALIDEKLVIYELGELLKKEIKKVSNRR